MASTKLHPRLNHLSTNDATTFIKQEEKSKFALFDQTNVNNLGNYYLKDESTFKKKLDKLNIRFYLETDKFLNFKHEMEKSQDTLFLLLFKQVSIYVEEIERLNIKMREKEDQEKFNKFKLDEINKKESSEKDIIYYKSTIRNLEKRINETKLSEDKLKKENESYKRQIMFYKDKLKIELSAKKIENNIFNFTNLNTPNPKRMNSTSKYRENKISFNNENLNDINKNVQKDNYFSIMTLTDDNQNNINNGVVHTATNEINESVITERIDKKIDTSKVLKLTCISTERVKDYNDTKTINYNEVDFNNSKTKKLIKFSPVKKPPKRRNISAFELESKKESFTFDEKVKKSRINVNLTPISIKNPTTKKNNSKNFNVKSCNATDLKTKISKIVEKNIPIITSIDKKTISNEEYDISYNLKDDEINIDPKELHDFANLFCENINEELDLLNKEEEVLMYLKNDLLLNSHNDDGLLEKKGHSLTVSRELPTSKVRRPSGSIPVVNSNKRNIIKPVDIKKKK